MTCKGIQKQEFEEMKSNILLSSKQNKCHQD